MSDTPGVRCITLMGVPGCGKTTIGKALAGRLGWQFIESDDFHSETDLAKMSNGIPLTDEDRLPWLRALNMVLISTQGRGENTVLACSALKASYREALYAGIQNGVVVFMRGSYDQIWSRMQKRDHFMKPEMLQSQYDDLEEQVNTLTVDIQDPPEKIVDTIIHRLHLSNSAGGGPP